MCEELLDDLPAPWQPRGSAVLCRNTQMLLGTGAARLENCAAPLAVCVIEKEGETRDLYGQSIVAWSQIGEGSPFTVTGERGGWVTVLQRCAQSLTYLNLQSRS